MANDREIFIHRIGRSGRFGRKAISVTFLIKEELWKIKDLEKSCSMILKELPFNVDNCII